VSVSAFYGHSIIYVIAYFIHTNFPSFRDILKQSMSLPYEKYNEVVLFKAHKLLFFNIEKIKLFAHTFV